MLYGKIKTGVMAICLINTLVFSPFLFAQNAQDYFKQGVEAARSNDYGMALVQFRKAKMVGLDTAALNYNLAVAYYRLGQFEEARKVFASLSDDTEYIQIAYFNLGLVANKQKDRSAAVGWFRRAYFYGEPAGSARKSTSGEKNKITMLAAEALRRLDAPPVDKSPTRKSWTGFLNTSLTSDSNVTLVNNDLVGVTSEKDQSMSLTAYGARWVKGSEGSGVRLFLNAHLQQYSAQNQYNYHQLSIGAARYDRLGDWRMRFGGAWDEIYFGGDKYQRLISAEVRGRKPWSENSQFRMRYNISRIHATNPSYNYLEGWRQQFRVGTRMRSGTNRYRAYYQLELNDRQDYVGTVDPFTSYSPTRHMLRITGWWSYASTWTLRLDGRYRYSIYNDDNVLAGFNTKRREDSQTRASGQLSKQFLKNWEINTTYTITDSHSSIGEKSYDRTQASVGVSWRY